MTGSAKQSIYPLCRAMDCFRLRSLSYGGQVATLAMTLLAASTTLRHRRKFLIQISNSRCDFAISRRVMPELCEDSPSNRGSRECRVRAAPAVSCAKLCEKNAHEHTGSAETLRHSPRNGFTAYGALSSATNSSCHRHRRIEGLVTPGWANQTSADLTPATGARTTRFWRTQQPRSSCARRSLTEDPPCDHPSRRRCRVHRIPLQRS